MKRSQKAAVLTLLNRELLANGSWCGETHIQKATFFLQELTMVDLDFEFVLYRHGPFSFDLRDELLLMQADELISLQIRHPGYGPALIPTAFSESFLERFPNTVARYGERVRFIASELGRMNVAELERLATAYYITQRSEEGSLEERADQLVELKPHILVDDAFQAFQDVGSLIEKARDVVHLD
jgi:hypothetical protein